MPVDSSKLNRNGHSFEFTTAGIVNRSDPDMPRPELVQQPEPDPAPAEQNKPHGLVASSKPQPKVPRRPQQPQSPRDIVKAARARIREIKSELKQHAKLKRELAELERLVKAAKEKPSSNVRAIRRTGS